MPSSPWCKSIAIDRNENYVAVGFEESVVRFFKTTSMEHPREDRLHAPLHDDCKQCSSVDTLSFSHDGLALLASTRNHKGLIQLYLWRFPFVNFHELMTCRYHVRPHESEDNGISSALLQSGNEGTDNLICVTTWTQSGTPVLVQPRSGHKATIQPEGSVKHGKVGSRIQNAAFSPSGQELALVNDKGHLYQIHHINSSPLDIKRIATTKEMTAKSPSFAMGYMTMGDEDAIVMAWADSSKMTGWVKKIPVSRVSTLRSAQIRDTNNNRARRTRHPRQATFTTSPPIPLWLQNRRRSRRCSENPLSYRRSMCRGSWTPRSRVRSR